MYKLQPTPGKVVIKVDDPEQMYKGTIVLPENARDNVNIGTIVAVNLDGWWEHGGWQIPKRVVGERVVVGKYAGTDVLVKEERFVIMKEMDILAVLVESAENVLSAVNVEG